METHWAIDLGTTNTLIAKWSGTHAVTVPIGDIVDFEPAWRTPLIPSVIFFQEGGRPIIGKAALSACEIDRSIALATLGPLARSFKKTLARSSQQAVARVGTESISARQCATAFVGELLDQTAAFSAHDAGADLSAFQRILAAMRFWRKPGQVTDLTMTVPIESYEPYRAELSQMARKLGVSHFRTLDEPVAAALGYGIDLTDEKYILVVDFGGGTLDLAVVRTHAAGGSRGAPPGQHRATLLAGRGMNLGGETIDGWITDLGCAHLRAHADALRPLLAAQAEAIKKDLSNKASIADSSYFLLPSEGRIEVTRQQFLDLLEERQLYRSLETLTEAALDDCAREVGPEQISGVLLVGGSTLLPGVRDLFERLFGPQRVHYWEPFEAVVKGAAVFGAGFAVDQIVHHDYAIRVYNDSLQAPEYERLVRRGTGYPTPKPFETRYYAVTEEQSVFRLPICEVGYAGRTALAWQRRMNANEYWKPTGAEENECVITLNEGDHLRLVPPGSGSQARLRIDFNIDANRYLCATIHDLLRKRDLRTDQRVVMLR